jgi:hypothetical protein
MVGIFQTPTGCRFANDLTSMVFNLFCQGDYPALFMYSSTNGYALRQILLNCSSEVFLMQRRTAILQEVGHARAFHAATKWNPKAETHFADEAFEDTRFLDTT